MNIGRFVGRFLLVQAFLATGAAAQPVSPPPGPTLIPEPNESRMLTIAYDAKSIVPLTVAPNYQLTVMFADGEKISSVAVGDSGAWQVSASRSGESLFIKPIGYSQTNMTVITDARVYFFDLVPGSVTNGAYLVRFIYPDEQTALPASDVIPREVTRGGYRLSGSRALRPETIDDDGAKTYIAWPDGAVMPAVFAIDPSGQEMLVDGYMRDGLYTIDRIYTRLIFRYDRQVASATRRRP